MSSERTKMKKLYPEERLARIMEIINEKKKVEVEELVDTFNVTGATIRGDLRELQRRNLVTRTHGGALLTDESIDRINVKDDPIYRERIQNNLDYKSAIGRKAAELVNDDDSIIVDDGSTTLQVIKSLDPEKRVTVLTNGLDICYELLRHPKAIIYSTGGKVNKEDFSYYGNVALEVTSRFNASKAILGTSGISVARGVATPSEEKSALKRAMISNSDEVIIVADHTKINRTSFIDVCPIEEIDVLVTDDRAPADFVAELQALGIRVIQATRDEARMGSR
jgi:DeoR/GlpR family transcriptional regulator of sugar metabolism